VRTDRLQREFGVSLRWSVFPLHPDIPDEGMPLSVLFAGREASVRESQSRLMQSARAEGLPMGARTHTYNSRLAQELGKWAERQGAGDLFRRAVYRAYFVEGANIARADVLTGLAREAGLPEDGALAVVKGRTFAASVDADWQRAGALEVSAVPTHLCGRRRLAGFAPFEDFLRLIGKSRIDNENEG
jgi:predicted DsbA family dithiol-disulfide isomerase